MVTMGCKMTEKGFFELNFNIFWKLTYSSHFLGALNNCLLLSLNVTTISAHLLNWQVVIGWNDHLGDSILLTWSLSSRWLHRISWHVYLNAKGHMSSFYLLWRPSWRKKAAEELCSSNDSNWLLVLVTCTVNESVCSFLRLDWAHYFYCE